MAAAKQPLVVLSIAARSAGIAKRRFLVVSAMVLLAAIASVEAASVTAKGGTGNLNKKQSWVGNKAPGAADVAVWNSSSTATTASLGANLSWLGIQIVNPAGAIIFNAGNTLTLGSAGIDMSSATVNFTLNCAVVLGAAQTWNVDSGRILAASGVVSGSGGLTKSGLGTLVLSGSNTYTGSTTINGGTVSVASGSGLGTGSGALTISPTGIFQATGTFSTSRAVVLGGTGGASSGGTFDVATGVNETSTGVISGSGSLIKTGNGTLTLSANNSFAGDLYLNGGTVVANSSDALGPQPPALGSALYATHLANGTTLQSTNSSPGANRQLELVSGSATLDVVSAAVQQRNGLVYGNGGLTKAGAGTLILTGANSYSGGTTVNAGVLQLNNPTGSGTGSGAVTINSGATLSGLPVATGYASTGSISGVVTVRSGGALIAVSGGTFTFGGLNLNASAVSNFLLGAITSVPLINITGNNGLALSGLSAINVVNVGGLGVGMYHLFDYTGTALASIANLQLGSTPGGGFSYALSNNQSNTSIDLLVSTSNEQWSNDANGNWSAASSWGNGAAANAPGAQANFLGVINIARTVAVDGAFTVGTITFNNPSSYTLASDGVNGHGITLNNNGTAAIQTLAGSHTIAAPLTLANDLDLTAITGSGLTVSGAIGESGSARAVTSDGAGTVTFSGSSANTYTGLTSVSAGTLNLNKTAGVNAIGAGGLVVAPGGTVASLASHQLADAASVTLNGRWSLGAFSETIAALNGIGSVTTAAGSVLTIGASNNLDSQFDGVISGGGTLAKAGTGTLMLSGANTFGGAGQTIAVNRGTLAIASDSNLGNVGNSLTVTGSTLAFGGSFSSNRALILSGSDTLDSGSNVVAWGGTVSGTGGLTKSGTGSIALNGANSYTGGTTINAGTIQVSSSSSLGASSGGVMINAGTLEVTAGFSSTRNMVLGNSSSTVQVNAGQTYTIGGVVSGTGALNKTGAGALSLTSANTFTGETVVDGGTLTAAATSGRALPTTSAITVNSGGTLLLGASNQISDTAPVTLDGGTIAKGNFSEGSASAVGLGALTLTAPDSHLDFGRGTVGTLSFASFDSGINFDLLVIDNWTGTANSVGNASTDRLIFDATQTTNLSYFSFTGYGAGAAQFNLGNGFYEVVPLTVTPVPEPATYGAAVLALVGVAAHRVRKRTRALRSP